MQNTNTYNTNTLANKQQVLANDYILCSLTACDI